MTTIPQQPHPTHDSYDAALARLIDAHEYREAGRAGDLAALLAPYGRAFVLTSALGGVQ